MDLEPSVLVVMSPPSRNIQWVDAGQWVLNSPGRNGSTDHDHDSREISPACPALSQPPTCFASIYRIHDRSGAALIIDPQSGLRLPAAGDAARPWLSAASEVPSLSLRTDRLRSVISGRITSQAPTSLPGFSGFKLDEVGARTKCVRRAGHWFDGHRGPAPLGARDFVCGIDH